MAYFDELLQRAITVRNNRAPASNTADLVGGVLVGIVTALQMLLDDKQDELTFDTAPTADSQNPVTSNGIYQALQAIDLSACEKIVNKVTSINAQSTDVQYPTAKLLYDSLQALSGIYAAIQHTHAIADVINLQTELNARQLVSNLVTAITAQSTDQQYPSAKLLYDQLALKANQATTYTKTEVDALISALSTISFVVVQQLPTSDIQTNVIYLVPAAQPGQSNIYNEYIYVNNNWELIGSTAIDLSGYEQTVNKVTALTAQATNVQYPSARAVYDAVIASILPFEQSVSEILALASATSGVVSFYANLQDKVLPVYESASEWIIRSMTTLQLWLRADNVELTDGAVSRWLDMSPNDYVIQQTTPAARPTVEHSAVGGKPAVAFGGSNYLIGNNILNLNTDEWIFFVVGQYNNEDSRINFGPTFFSKYDRNTDWGSPQFFGGQYLNCVYWQSNPSGGSQYNPHSNSINNGNDYALYEYELAVRDNSQFNWKTYYNGTLKDNIISTLVNYALTTTAAFKLGHTYITTANNRGTYLNGHIAEIIVFNKVDANTRQIVRSYLSARYGITIS